MSAVTAAAITAGALLVSTKMQTSASGKAAKTQVASANEAARIGGISAQNQLDFVREEANKARIEAELARSANYGQWKAGLQNTRGQDIAGLRNDYNMFGDRSFNDRASEVSRGRTDVGMFNAGAYNTRSSNVATDRNAYARFANRERRLDTLGRMLGQEPRQIAAHEDPAALREAQYFEPDPLQRTALELPPDLILPDYVPGNRNA